MATGSATADEKALTSPSRRRSWRARSRLTSGSALGLNATSAPAPADAAWPSVAGSSHGNAARVSRVWPSRVWAGVQPRPKVASRVRGMPGSSADTTASWEYTSAMAWRHAESVVALAAARIAAEMASSLTRPRALAPSLMDVFGVDLGSLWLTLEPARIVVVSPLAAKTPRSDLATTPSPGQPMSVAV